MLALVIGAAGAAAQTPPVQRAAAIESITLVAGRSTVLPTAFDITRIAITDPAIADAVVVQPREILIDGKSTGTVSLIVWGTTERRQFDVVVEPGVGVLQRQLRTLFPGEDITVSVSDEAVVLSGQVSNNTVVARAGEIAQASSAKAKVINLLRIPDDQGNQQVMLQVRFAEVNRNALTELGATFFARHEKFDARATTQQFPAPDFEGDDELTFSDFLNLFFFSRTEGIGAIVRAMQRRGDLQTLAEPNLIAYNGQEASFLAGGEFPVPIVQGATGTVTIEWKEFGVRLTFRPTIVGDVIRLKVRPEVSTLDFGNGIVLEGFRIPTLSTRRAETEVELRDGQGFAIAGLLSNTADKVSQKIPILGDLPILGSLFRSRSTEARRTELLVLITPRLVRPLNADELPPLPVDQTRFLRPEIIRQMPGSAGAIDPPPGAPAPPPVKKPGGGL